MPACADSRSAPLASARDWREIFALLDSALDLDPAEHVAWLESLGSEQSRLSPLLGELLRVHADVGSASFLQGPPSFGLAHPPRSPGPAARALVGPYRLLREVGQGGMASVWLAERADGLLARQVALKLPHVGWGVASFADRMARERNILASLTHPNIARLYDAGVTEDDRPYLALEYVDGEPIDVHARSHGLELRSRVELVVQVARAVAYAHSRLVVHRDLKPSNILVDAAGRVHLLDFGIAKLVDPQLEDAAGTAQLTQAAGGRALTPDYASPEQIRGDSIGTVSDVYSLGVVLFELLAGARPYRLQPGLGAIALAEAITRTDAPLASTTTADAGLRRQLQGDLDAILARALAKPVDERYPTMDALADDLERHLRGEAVQARPHSPRYLAERWVRRHKLETAIALAVLLAVAGGAYAQVLVLLALAGGATVALWQRNRALREAERAHAALTRAEQVKAFIASIFTQAVPRAGHGGAVTAADLLQAASRRVETDLAAQPEAAAELGALIGTSLNELGEYRASLDWLPKVVERCTRALGPTHPLSLQSRCQLAYAANSAGELAVSEPLLPGLVSDLRGAQPTQAELLVSALRSHAFVHTKRGREAAAMAALNEAVEVATSRFGQASEAALGARAALSNTFTHFGHSTEALRAIEPALAPARAAFGAQRPHPLLLAVERFHGDALARLDRPREAAVLLRQVLSEQRALDAEETSRVRIAQTLLANALMLGGHLDEAETLIEEAEALHERLTGGANDEGIGVASRHALICALRGDGGGALRCLARADAWAAASGEQAALAVDRTPLRALALVTAGQPAQALTLAELLPPDRLAALPATARVRWHRARAFAHRELGAPAAAREHAERALDAAAAGGCNGIEHGLALVEAARCGHAAGALEKAERQWQAAFEVLHAGQVDGPALLQPLHAEFAALQAPR